MFSYGWPSVLQADASLYAFCDDTGAFRTVYRQLQQFWDFSTQFRRPLMRRPWSDFILPKLLLKERDYYTVAVGLMSLDETEFARFAAGSVFIAVPIVLLYFCLVKNMVNGIADGAVKG